MLNDAELINGTPLVVRAKRGFERHLRFHLYSSGGDGGAAKNEAARQARITKGQGQLDDMFSQYDDKFYHEKGKAYTQFAEPQMQQQFDATKKNLAFSLARNGILNSSTASERNNSLQTEMAKNQGTIANSAQGVENDLRNKMAQARGDLTQQLVSSGDPSMVMSNASAATAAMRAPTPMQPLGQMFQDWSNTYLSNMNTNASKPATSSLWQMMQSQPNSAAYTG